MLLPSVTVPGEAGEPGSGILRQGLAREIETFDILAAMPSGATTPQRRVMNAEASTAQNWFVIDAPVSDVEKDAFGHDDIADNLHRMVTEPSSHRRMIGLFGEFGVGKSSIIQLLQAKLKGHKNLRVIRMSAERHEPVGFHRASVYGFAEALVDAGELTASEAEEILEPLRSAQTLTISDAALSPLGRAITTLQQKLKMKRKGFFGLIAGAILAAILVIGLIGWVVGPETWASIQQFVVPIVTGSTFFVPLAWMFSQLSGTDFNFSSLLTPGTNVTQRPRVEAADEHERAFAALAAKAEHRLVVAVDDIDRLSKQQILEALNAIRSFQLTCKRELRPIFIVSIAEKIIRSALSINDGLDDAHAQDFLNRLFTLRQEVPIHESLDLSDYACDALRSQAPALAGHLGTRVDDVVAMLIHDDVADPRHVVRLINAFSSDYRLALARETRDGRRALRENTVTAQPDVLARVVVLKTDFPTFFKAALDDLDLVDSIARASSINDSALAEDALLPFPRDEHPSLYKYLARTAGWVPSDVDLFPFFFLGQNRISLTLGNAEARKLRSALANNQSAELAPLVVAAEASGLEAVELFRELLVSVLRELENPELSNAASAVIQVAATSDTLQDQEIARAVAAAAHNRPEAITDVAGAIALANVATAQDAKTLLAMALEVDGEDAENTLWDARVLVRDTLGEQMFSEWVLARIAAVGSWNDIARWRRADLGDTFAIALLSEALALAAQPGEAAVADEDDLTNVLAVVDQVTERAPVPNLAALRAAIVVGADTYESAVAHATTAAFKLSDQELTDLLRDSRKSEDAVAEDDESLTEVQDGVAALTVRMAAQHAAFGFWENTPTPHSAASIGSSLIAAWIAADTYPVSRAVPVLRTMVEQNAKAHTSLANAVLDAWIRDPAASDADEVPLVDSAEAMTALLPQMENEAAARVKDAWVAALGDEDSRPLVASLASHVLTADTPAEWADEAMAQLVPLFQRTVDFTTDATDATALIVATGRVSEECERELLDALVAVLAYSGVARARALSSIAQIPWSETLSQEVIAAITPHSAEFEDADYWTMFDLFVSRSLMDASYVAPVDTHITEDSPTPAMVARAGTLAGVLTMENGTKLALAAESQPAIDAVADRCAHFTDDAEAIVASLLRQIATELPPAAIRDSFAAALASADEDVYTSAVRLLLADTLDVGGTRDKYLWRFVTVPLPAAVRNEIWAAVEPDLTASVREATYASVVLHATGEDKYLDQLVAKSIESILLHWITEEPNATVASALGSAVSSGAKSRAAARRPAVKKWRLPERKTAASAAAAALK